MLNFLHKPCCADGDKAEKIGERLKRKCDKIRSNALEALLTLRIGTMTIPYIKLSEITDFPRLSKKH